MYLYIVRRDNPDPQNSGFMGVTILIIHLADIYTNIFEIYTITKINLISKN